MAKQPVYVDISQEIRDWINARFGRQVRGANVSALTKFQDQSNSAVDYIIGKGQEIDQTRKDADDILQSASGAVDHANSITAEYKKYADDKLAATELQRQAAETAKDGADSASLLAESWAHGDTGARPAENVDNSKYHSQQSKTEADRAKSEADRASQYSQIVAPGFYLDIEDGTLYMKTGVGVDFYVDEDSEIYWKIAT